MHFRKIKKDSPVKQFKTKRVCKMAGCKQQLSIYNSEVYCHVHRWQNVL
jgi:hypothetical protein